MPWDRRDPNRYAMEQFEDPFRDYCKDLFHRHQRGLIACSRIRESSPRFPDWGRLSAYARHEHRLFYRRDREAAAIVDRASSQGRKAAYSMCQQCYRAAFDARASESIALLEAYLGWENNAALLDGQAAMREWMRLYDMIYGDPDRAAAAGWLTERFVWFTLDSATFSR